MAANVNMRGQGWDDVAVAALIAMVHGEGLTNEQIAARTNRTVSAVSTAISRYAIRAPVAKLRKCMPCRKPFLSTDRGNWICGMCKQNRQLMECA